jgi:adenylylsulfate reductase subunit B
LGVWIDQKICIGCGGCIQVCPGDLIYLNAGGKAENRYPDECWHCMACVKVCAQKAIWLNLPFSIANRGARLLCESGNEEIRWTCVNPDGGETEFVLPKKSGA